MIDPQPRASREAVPLTEGDGAPRCARRGSGTHYLERDLRRKLQDSRIESIVWGSECGIWSKNARRRVVVVLRRNDRRHTWINVSEVGTVKEVERFEDHSHAHAFAIDRKVPAHTQIHSR